MNEKPYSRIERLAQDLFAQRLVLTCSGDIWTDKPLDPALLQDVRTHWPKLVHLMKQGSLLLCPAHRAHRKSRYFDHDLKRWICGDCLRLHPEVAKEVC